MQIDDELIAYLEDLSCLTLSTDEKDRLKTDLEEILAFMAKLGSLNTEGVEGLSHPFDNVNAFRDDKAEPSYSRELILQNAAQKNEEMFIAPKTVD